MSVVVLGSPKQIQSIMTPQYTMHVMQTVRITACENVNINDRNYISTVKWANHKKTFFFF